MAIEEQETSIIINQADLRDGFFIFGTSRECDYNKLVRKVGELKVLETRLSTDKEGGTNYWTCKVARDCLSPSGFGLMKPNSSVGRKGNIKKLCRGVGETKLIDEVA